MPKPPRIERAVKAGGFLAVPLADIIEALKAVEKRYPGLDRVICATPLDVPLEDLDRFAAVEISRRAEPAGGRLRSMALPHRRV